MRSWVQWLPNGGGYFTETPEEIIAKLEPPTLWYTTETAGVVNTA